MANEHDPGLTSFKHSSSDFALQDHPGGDALPHEGKEWILMAERRLAGRGLLQVANGGEPADAAALRDLPILPLLDESHRDAERRKEERVRAMTANEEKAIKRFQITMRDWTTLYTVVTKSMEKNASLAARELHEACNLRKRGVDADAYDGPLVGLARCEITSQTRLL